MIISHEFAIILLGLKTAKLMCILDLEISVGGYLEEDDEAWAFC
jgi:hypothetical protein